MKCIRPFEARNRLGVVVHVPCSKCIACRIKKSQDWALRIVHEAMLYKKNCFITLTYRDKDMPKDMSLSKTDLKKFCKDLRNRGLRFRYFASGEYGDEHKSTVGIARPHYHMILFGHDFRREHEKRSWFTEKTPGFLYDVWKKGNVVVGNVTYNSAFYTAKYCQKQLTGERMIEYLIDSDTGQCRMPEFCVMSRRPGIGKVYFDIYLKNRPDDSFYYKGIKYSLPRYYYKLKYPDTDLGKLHNKCVSSVTYNIEQMNLLVDDARKRMREPFDLLEERNLQREKTLIRKDGFKK